MFGKKKNKNAVSQTARPAQQTGDYVLEVSDLVVHYELENETVEAVNNISLKLKKGETIGLVGETGAGKSSTALAILNMVPDPPGVIKQGSIFVNGHDMLHMKSDELEKVRGKDISIIFQDPMTSLNPVMTVGEQIAESIIYHEPVNKAEAMERAKEMLEMVGIPGERAAEYPHQFSGGMKQRVVIAIALSCNPKCLLADEPTTALDVTIQAQVLDMMNDLKKRMGTSLVMITHDLGVIAAICDTVAVMYAGKIVEYGTLEDIFNHTMHPYTEGLFNSLPRINKKGDKLIPIPGLMPDPTKLPKGCAFEPRCKYATPACREKPVENRQITETHTVMCCAYDDPDFKLDRKEA